MFILRRTSAIAALMIAAGLSGSASAAEQGTLQAGAARVDITPPANAIPKPYSSILDHIYARAIYLDNGHDRVVLMNADLADPVIGNARQTIAEQLNVPIQNVLISATHDHNAIINNAGLGLAKGEKLDPAVLKEAALIESGLVEAAKEAKARMQPARIGYGTGVLYLNVNRDAIDDQSRLWAQEPNPDYPSDKTLAVIKIESLSGDLIAVYMNYAMHAVSLFLNGKLSGDFPGEAERYIERNYHDKTVAIWSSGAAGDQNPLYVRANWTLTEARVKAVMNAEHLDESTAISRAMFVGDPAMENVSVDPVLVDESLEMVKSEGQLMAEEAIRIMNHIRDMKTEVQIETSEQVLTCPARKRLDNAREGVAGKYEDSPDPVHVSLGAMRIGDIALGTANAELYNMIGQEVKKGSKLHDTIVVTLANSRANSGYIPTDDAFGRNTFQVLGSRLKPGCAETGIVNGIDGMIEKMD